MANRFLNNITINDAYTLPSNDGSTGQAIITDGAGNLSFGSVAAASAASAESVHLHVKNTSGAQIAKGTPVYITGNVGNTEKLEIAPADASDSAKMPAVGVLESTLNNNSEGFVVQGGFLKDVNTSTIDGTSGSSNDTIYVKSGGGLTLTKPTGSTVLIQNIGKIARVHGSNGSIVVSSILRANDVPNLTSGKIWVGDGNTIESTVVEIDETNNILDVDGKIYFKNIFPALTDLPSATTYHGMFAHVHAEGAAYYAHAGNWVKLANYSDLAGSANDATITLTAGTGLNGGGTFTTDQAIDGYVTVNLDSTAVTPGTYGDANNTPQITIDQQGRITSATTVTTAGSGSSGGGAELSIERDVITATANQQVFTISSDITASSNTQVYIDGVYQAKSNYTTSGSTITFSTGVSAGAEVEVVHFISVLSRVYVDPFTGDNSEVNFDASKDVSDENVTQVYIDGVYQSKDNYTTSGTTITFSTAPPSGSAIEVVHFTAATYSTLNSNQFTGTGSLRDFTLTQAVDVDTSFVFIQGVYQEKDQYSISGTTLTFVTAPQSGYSIEVVTVGAVANVTSSPVNSVNGLTGDVTVSGGTDWQATPKTADFTAIVGEGYFVDTTSAVITVTLPGSPTAGDEVSIVDYAGTADTNNITITSSDNINGASDDVVINYERGGVSMVYVDATQGWIAYNAANETATALAPDGIIVDYLVVAGGGGGGYSSAGGGGAGGLRTSYGSTSGGGASAESSLSLEAATNYTVTVGSGGSAGTSSNTSGGLGVNSVFSTITSNGGGGGGNGGQSGTTGGSGGGGGYLTGSLGGSGTTNQGYSGGDGRTGSGAGGSNDPFSAGGGGGAFESGGDATIIKGGDGGDGLAVNILNTTNATAASVGEVSGSDVYFSGGGGAGADNLRRANSDGAGGLGGGGAGGDNGLGNNNSPGVVGEDGDDNTGGAGGGGNGAGNGGVGGSGVVILRYPSDYTITVGAGIIEASGSPFTEGTDTVSVFTGGTGNISFS